MFCKEFHSLVDGHLQDVVHVFSLETHVQDVFLEALSVAAFTFQYKVGHELHFHGYCAFAFTFLTASAIGVETEESGRISHLLGQRKVGHELAYFVPSLDVGDGIGARAFANGVLVHELDASDLLHIALQCGKFSGAIGSLVQVTLHAQIKDIANKAALSASAYTGYARHYMKGNFHVNSFQIVRSCTDNLDGGVPRPAA